MPDSWTHTWSWSKRPIDKDRKGMRCRLIAIGRLGSVEGAATWATREELLAGTYGEVVRRIFTAYDAQIAEALDGH